MATAVSVPVRNLLTVNEWIRWLLTVPVTGGLLGGVNFLRPAARLSRRIRSNSALAQTLPAGEERDWFEKQVVIDARRLVNYHTLLPRSDKILSVFSSLILVYLALFFLIDPDGFFNELSADGPFEWCLAAAALLMAVPMAIFAVLGRSSQGVIPEQYAEYVDGQRAAYRQQQFKRIVRRRARNVGRLRKRPF